MQDTRNGVFQKNLFSASQQSKSITVLEPLWLDFSDWCKYTDLKIIWENDLTKLCKNIKHNSDLIKCHRIATKSESILQRPAKKPSDRDTTVHPPFSLRTLSPWMQNPRQAHTNKPGFKGRKWRPVGETIVHLPSAFSSPSLFN